MQTTYGVQELTEREKETLRRLLRGHDAKSIARELNISVHTVNERLRDARRKLNVTSSREAARLLAEMEQGGPNFLADKQMGVVANPSRRLDPGGADRRQSAGPRFAWLAGGMLVMSIIIATVALLLTTHGGDAIRSGATQDAATAVSADASAQSATTSAREWIALLDAQRWDETWRMAAPMFKSQVTPAQWVAAVQPLRQSLGSVISRSVASVTAANSLPGAPAGEYEIIQFQTNFAHKSDGVETVTLAREGSNWKIAGYFVR